MARIDFDLSEPGRALRLSITLPAEAMRLVLEDLGLDLADEGLEDDVDQVDEDLGNAVKLAILAGRRTPEDIASELGVAPKRARVLLSAMRRQGLVDYRAGNPMAGYSDSGWHLRSG